MPAYQYLLDNHNATVVDGLRRNLRAATAFDLVSAYFTINGYELLADELDGVERVRFLFGDPGSVDNLDPGPKDPKSFELAEPGFAPNHTLEQKALAKRCARWLERDAVAVRSVQQSNFLHGKMYLTAGPGGAAGIVGSSNFTKRGLGGSDRANLEINLATADAAAVAELQDWFERLWQDPKRTVDVKGQVLAALERLHGDQGPHTVYYKTLYELFRQDIAARLAGDEALKATGFTESEIWNTLYEFQKDGAKSLIAKLNQHRGCILADSVGLGKTYTALAVIKYFELRNERALVLCPQKLRANWSLYQAANNYTHNPFPQDRFGYTLLAHTDLSRNSGESGGIDLANFNWGNYDLVVIDESHNFRNDGGQRYRRLLEEVIAAGSKTKVLLLSATPVNTSLVDLRNQIYLMTEGRDDAFRESLGVGNIRSLMQAAQKQFKDWETGAAGKGRNGRRDKSQLLENLGADFLRLLDGVSISRSRRQIEQLYQQEMDRIGRFPEHTAPRNEYPPTDLRGELSYPELAKQIEQFGLAVYQPTWYVVDTARKEALEKERAVANFSQEDRERFLVGMMRTNFLKRLESSAYALNLTLERTIGKIAGLLDKIDRYEKGGGRSAAELAEGEVMPEEDEEDEDFSVNRGRKPYHLGELDLARWRADLEQDRATLAAVQERVKAVTPERDGKLQKIREILRERVEQPTRDQDEKPNRKLLVFTTFKDTAEYLYANLTGLAKELGINAAMVSGDESRAMAGGNTFNDILTNFAPVARNRAGNNRAAVAPAADIDLLIATDCISEGQNLQDCDTVLNYDIHWNPVRLIQRFGRIDRIGSRSQAVRMVNYWPTEDMEEYLKLESRVLARMALADITASGGNDPFTEEGAQLELDYRNEQLRRLKQEILAMEDLDDAPTLSDLTLNHFFAQLLRYLQENQDKLEALPYGVYAVVDGGPGRAPPGAIFFLRQRNAAANREARQQVVSPVHPWYFVYIQDSGQIRYGCGNAKQILEVFEATAVGRVDPILELCDRFDRETKQGQDMAKYNKLVRDAIAHISQAYAGTQASQFHAGGDRSFVLPLASETPTGVEDFELVTWLVIMERE